MSAIQQALLMNGTQAAIISFCDGSRHGADIGTTTITDTGLNAGTESPDRYLIAIFQCGTGTATGITTCTIGGVAATQLIEIGTSGDGFISVWIALVPTGATVNISAPVTGSANYTATTLYEVHGLQSTTLVDSDSDNAGGASAMLTMTLDTIENGFTLAAYNSFNSTASTGCAWSGTSGVVEAFDSFSAGTGIDATSAIVNSTSSVANRTAIANPGTTTSSERMIAITMR